MGGSQWRWEVRTPAWRSVRVRRSPSLPKEDALSKVEQARFIRKTPVPPAPATARWLLRRSTTDQASVRGSILHLQLHSALAKRPRPFPNDYAPFRITTFSAGLRLLTRPHRPRWGRAGSPGYERGPLRGPSPRTVQPCGPGHPFEPPLAGTTLGVGISDPA